MSRNELHSINPGASHRRLDVAHEGEDAHATAVRQTLEELDAVRALLAAGGSPEGDAGGAARWRLADLVAGWGQAHWRGARSALRRLRRELQAAEPDPGA